VYGLIITVLHNTWTPFAAKWTLPKVGWFGVFSIAIAFDLIAATLAYFVLRRMKAPVKASETQITAGASAPAA